MPRRRGRAEQQPAKFSSIREESADERKRLTPSRFITPFLGPAGGVTALGNYYAEAAPWPSAVVGRHMAARSLGPVPQWTMPPAHRPQRKLSMWLARIG